MGYYQKWEYCGVYVKGAKKGEPKYESKFVPGGHKDRFDLAAQMNCYRLMLERKGYPVKNMLCEVICKDGGSKVARSRGIDRIGYLIPVDGNPDNFSSLIRWDDLTRYSDQISPLIFDIRHFQPSAPRSA